MALSIRRFRATRPEQRVVLRFRPRSSDKPCLAFPCNSAGEVELDRLSHRDLNDYLFARALLGRYYEFPVIEPAVQ
jgi:hypothetical protein